MDEYDWDGDEDDDYEDDDDFHGDDEVAEEAPPPRGDDVRDQDAEGEILFDARGSRVRERVRERNKETDR